MAGFTRAIEAGRAFIRLTVDNDDASKQFRRSLHQMRQFARQVRNIGVGMTAVGAGAATATLPFLKAAADTESAMIRFRMIFREATDEGLKRVKDLSREFGTGFNQMIGQTSTFAAIFTDMRRQLSDEQFMDIVMRTQRVAIQLSTMMGIGMEEAANRLKSAFTSTGEAVDQFGINLRQAELSAEAQRLGLGNNIRAMSEATKQLVKLSIMERTFRDMGYDAAEATSSFNTQLAFLQSQLYDVRVNMGQLLRAVLTPLLKGMNFLIAQSKAFSVALSPIVAIAAIGGTALSAIGATVTFLSELVVLAVGGSFAIGQLTKGLRNLTKMWATFMGAAKSGIILENLTWMFARLSGAILGVAASLRVLLASIGPIGWAILAGSAAAWAITRQQQRGGIDHEAIRRLQHHRWVPTPGREAVDAFNRFNPRPSARTAAALTTAGPAVTATAGTMGPRVAAALAFAGMGGSAADKAMIDLNATFQRAFDPQEAALRVTGD